MYNSWNSSLPIATGKAIRPSPDCSTQDVSMETNALATYVYFISAGSNPIKIGVSDSPEQRLAELQTAHYKRLHLLFTISCTTRADAFSLENAFHRWYSDKRLMNEWFDIVPGSIQEDVTLLMGLAKSVVEFKEVEGFKIANRLEERKREIVKSPYIAGWHENPDNWTSGQKRLLKIIMDDPMKANNGIGKLSREAGIGTVPAGAVREAVRSDKRLLNGLGAKILGGQS